MSSKIFCEGVVGKKSIAHEKSSCENIVLRTMNQWKEETLIAFVVLITSILYEKTSLND